MTAVEAAALLHSEAVAEVAAAPALLFAHLDDQTRLGQHMSRSSAMMGGGRMTYEFDSEQGRAVGSHIRMQGSAFGLTMAVDEVVTERTPPRRKVWRTSGPQRLLIIDRYEMGFEVDPEGAGAGLRVWIDYELPPAGLRRWLGVLFAPAYARWCVRRMVADAVAAFASGVRSPAVWPRAA